MYFRYENLNVLLFFLCPLYDFKSPLPSLNSSRKATNYTKTEPTDSFTDNHSQEHQHVSFTAVPALLSHTPLDLYGRTHILSESLSVALAVSVHFPAQICVRAQKLDSQRRPSQER